MNTLQPNRYRVITADAAAWLWRKSAAYLRQLALKGKLPHQWTEIHGKRARLFAFEPLAARFGEPDPGRLGLLLELELKQVTGKGMAVWTVYMPRPPILTADGDLAVTMEGDE